MDVVRDVRISWRTRKSADWGWEMSMGFSFELESDMLEVAEGIGTAAPFANITTISFVDVSPSIDKQLYDLSTAVERRD